MSEQDLSWYVAFSNETSTSMWHWFTKKNFRHCFCMAQAHGGVLIVNYTGYYTEIKFAEGVTVEDFAMQLAQEDHQVLHVITSTGGVNKIRGLTYCVSSVKSCMNIKGCWGLTPYSLYRWLLKSDLEVYNLNDILESVRK